MILTILLQIFIRIIEFDMTFANIFELTVSGAAPLYPIIASLLCALSIAALFEFGYNRIIEKLYAQTTGWKMLWRVQLYVLLVNFPAVVLIISGLIYNNSILPLEVSLKMDQIYILIVSGYICFLEESRQTPVRGFIFIKDTFFILLTLTLLSDLEMNGKINLQYALTIVPSYLMALILQTFTDQIQNFILLLLGIREKNIYKASFLLTEKSHPSNFLEIKDIISTHQDQIEDELTDFVRIASQLKKSNEQLAILTNFAKIFIPIKKAYEIHEEVRSKQVLDEYQSQWRKAGKEEIPEKEQAEQEQTQKLHSFNHSASSLFIKKTVTNDSIFQNQDFMERKQQEQSGSFRFLKYSFYPLFLTTQISGRLRYFVDYLLVVLIGACMFLLANCIAYFSYFVPTNQNVLSLVYSLLLCYPVANYFIKISAGANDYDFLGIFMQGVILKIVIFSLGIVFLSIMSSESIMESGISFYISLLIRCGCYVVFASFLAWRRFAMRFNNFKFFVILFIVSEFLKIVQENVMDYLLV